MFRHLHWDLRPSNLVDRRQIPCWRPPPPTPPHPRFHSKTARRRRMLTCAAEPRAPACGNRDLLPLLPLLYWAARAARRAGQSAGRAVRAARGAAGAGRRRARRTHHTPPPLPADSGRWAGGTDRTVTARRLILSVLTKHGTTDNRAATEGGPRMAPHAPTSTHADDTTGTWHFHPPQGGNTSWNLPTYQLKFYTSPPV